MKRLILAIAAVASVAGPLAVTATATSAMAQDHGRYDRGNRQGDRGHGRYDRRDDRRDHRGDRRWDSRTRWDRGRHNGYYYNNRWYYGPPPAAYHGRPGYRPGHSAWRRGVHLPPSYRTGGYVVHDYGRYSLRPPPRGYYWYRDGNDYLLAAVASGLILDVIVNN